MSTQGHHGLSSDFAESVAGRANTAPSSVQCCFTSTETIRLIRDGERRKATLTFTQLLSSLTTQKSHPTGLSNTGRRLTFVRSYVNGRNFLGAIRQLARGQNQSGGGRRHPSRRLEKVALASSRITGTTFPGKWIQQNGAAFFLRDDMCRCCVLGQIAEPC